MAVSVLISFTFSWDLNEALSLMAGIYCGGVYGGSRSAILLNIPGAPAAVATGFDGYPLAKLGEAGIAIGLSTTASVIGGYIGIIALATCAPIISEYALLFAPRDYFLLAIMGLLLVGSLSERLPGQGDLRRRPGGLAQHDRDGLPSPARGGTPSEAWAS